MPYLPSGLCRLIVGTLSASSCWAMAPGSSRLPLTSEFARRQSPPSARSGSVASPVHRFRGGLGSGGWGRLAGLRGVQRGRVVDEVDQVALPDAPVFPCRIAPGQRFSANTQHGVDWGESAPAHPLRVFPRPRGRLQQAETGVRMSRANGRASHPRPFRHQRALCGHTRVRPGSRAGRARRNRARSGQCRSSQLPAAGAVSCARDDTARGAHIAR